VPRSRRDDDEFDERLEMDIFTDAKPDELWIGWYYSLDGDLPRPGATGPTRAMNVTVEPIATEAAARLLTASDFHPQPTPNCWTQRSLSRGWSRVSDVRTSDASTTIHDAEFALA
jgi:hypothetical protein